MVDMVVADTEVVGADMVEAEVVMGEETEDTEAVVKEARAMVATVVAEEHKDTIELIRIALLLILISSSDRSFGNVIVSYIYFVLTSITENTNLT